MNGVTSVSTNITDHTVDVVYDDVLVTVVQMKNQLDSQYYYVSHVNLSAAQAYNLLQTSSSILTVDVRERSEYCTGFIPGAVLSPWTSEVFKNVYLSILPTAGDILLVCKTGNRSSLAADFLYENYYSRTKDVIIYSITNGMDGWAYSTDVCPKPPPPPPPPDQTTYQPCINHLLLKN